MSNPNMMHLFWFGFEWPLLALDVHAHLLAVFVTGTTKLPTPKETRLENYKEALTMMKSALHRINMDVKYSWAFSELEKNLCSGKKTKKDRVLCETKNPLWSKLMNSQHCEDLKEMELLSKCMLQAKYPLNLVEPGKSITCPLNYSSIYPEHDNAIPKGLTENCALFYEMGLETMVQRQNTKHQASSKGKEVLWTYYDYVNGSKFCSMYTQLKACESLEYLWMNLW